MMHEDLWTNPHGEFNRERLQPYPPPPPPPPPPMTAHRVPGQPRLLRCSVVNLRPFEERNTILELEQSNQRLKNVNQELRERLEEFMDPTDMRQDFDPLCPNHQRQLQILAWEKDCPQMMEDPRTVRVLKQKICPRETHYTEKPQKELHQMRLSYDRKKTSITEINQSPQVWEGMSEVHMSLNDQAEGLLTLKKDIRDVLDEVEDIQMEILRTPLPLFNHTSMESRTVPTENWIPQDVWNNLCYLGFVQGPGPVPKSKKEKLSYPREEEASTNLPCQRR
ncbi:coiled-coil domain-containing protein 188 isoform X4 [Monodelphis domestica]|uniref:coiled-coil domain-containing protein 188 isoform X4 n=1 Tax=Monodelphis domestica TaxID=13616 RepID=UPI0024E1C13A|nr:coiled-coil domain-containing protein 188 isoform X4 [Monodelphis domestica]